jgi:hypothetical protein
VATFADLTVEQRAQAFAAMREDWALFGAHLLAWWQSGEPDLSVRPWAWVRPGEPDTLPWAAETFGSRDRVIADHSISDRRELAWLIQDGPASVGVRSHPLVHVT